ncbi:hypothetical protein UUU_31190 [Klebsiella pneumoniae subsp. pneumoniae DSM 30104 = JCM 1662 = NBRC 14940]|nr:hypothetical protein UUU_31190 [Klebsiella pneumoniae subsp. pneumoniae DSM 30104 = JCM 1662 = NBRC 14940]
MPIARQTSDAKNQGLPSIIIARIAESDSKLKMEGLVFIVIPRLVELSPPQRQLLVVN